MVSHLEYDFGVKRLIPASVAVFALSVFSPSHIYAQFNTPGTSAASSHIVTGTVPSVTGGVRPPTGPVIPPTGPVRPPTSIPLPPANIGSGISFGVSAPRVGGGGHRHHHHHEDVGPAWYAIPVPYAVDPGYADDQATAAADDEDANYQGGPTVFDRRGSGADSYVLPVDEVAPRSTRRANDPIDDPAPPQPTVLIFKDGHKLEVVNYAIVGPTLFDMTPGHARRVLLADLDLEATRQQNEDRGIVFQLPMSQAN